MTVQFVSGRLDRELPVDFDLLTDLNIHVKTAVSPQKAVLWDHKHFASVSTYLARSRRLQALRDLRSQDIVAVPEIGWSPRPELISHFNPASH